MKRIKLLLIIAVLAACTKKAKINKRLSGETWQIVTYTQTFYAASNITNQATAANAGSFTFGKENNATLVLSATLSETNPGLAPMVLNSTKTGKFEVFGSNDEIYDAKISIDAPGDYFSYGINEVDRSTMKFTSLYTRQSFYGDGYVIEMTLKKE